MRVRARIFIVTAVTSTVALLLVTLLIVRTLEGRGIEAMSVVRGPLLAGVAVILALAALFAWAFTRALPRRIDAITTAARRAIAGDHEARARDVQTDEIGLLARTFNDLTMVLGVRIEDLARDRARMEAILSGMVEGVLVVSQQGHVQLINDAARRMLRLDDSAIGRRYLELIRHPEIAAQLARALHGQTPGGAELSLGRDANQTLIARAASVSSSGQTGAVLVLHDITDLRRADRIRRDFVANVSHELRTPLTAIRGYVEALLDAPPREEETRRFLEIIARHSSRMERLVKDLLRLARLDAGQEALERSPCSVETLFGGVIADLTPVLEGRRQDVDIVVGRDAGTVVGDPAKLHDVLRNLIENASNYSPHGSRIDLQSRVDGSRVVLEVSDQGPGIPDVDLTRIFERFYRVDKDRSRESGGTGLGLSIVRHLVELHGGDVQASNKPSGGAVFTVRLPRDTQPLALENDRAS